MKAAGWIFFLTALLFLGFTASHNHSGAIEIYHVGAGHLFLLRCPNAESPSNITWSREGGSDLNLPAGVEVKDGLLWFKPVQLSHHGSYTCEKRDETGSFRITVSVSSTECPDPPEYISIREGVTDGVPCKQNEILNLNNTRNIRWLKDCGPVTRKGGSIHVHEDGFMRLPSATQEDAGIYTCLVDISLDGKKYTSARSIELKINNEPVNPQPKVVFPHQEVVLVEVGKKAELKCFALIGFSEDNDTLVYWTVDGNFSDDYEEFRESKKYFRVDDQVYCESTLTISEVKRWFLNVIIGCHVMTEAGVRDSYVMLQEADQTALYTSVALCILTPLTVLLLVVALLFFRVDLVLAYRKLSWHFTKKQALDGKLYDAYVSFLHPETVNSAEMESFALQTLPEELEEKYGYSLFIRGRDDCPGEAVHDAIAATLSQCHRLIILLSPVAKPCSDVKQEEVPMNDNLSQLCYEHKVGLFDALTQNSQRVILIEIDGPVDYSLLPESLCYIQRKQGALKWRKPSAGNHRLCKSHSNRNLWKNLRYHMPSVPSGKSMTVV